MEALLERCRQQLQAKRPFVVYRKPNTAVLNALLQKDAQTHPHLNADASGFIMVPFDAGSAVMIPEAFADRMALTVGVSQMSGAGIAEDQQAGKAAYEACVAKAISAMQSGDFQKVVLSRRENLTLPQLDWAGTFEQLLSKYPSAFVYCWYHPVTGMWIGATPEKLISIRGGQFETMALAGTRKFKAQDVEDWGEKEREEQQIVTDFILENLEQFSTDLSFSSPYTHQAGNLLHLKTDISGTMGSASEMKHLLEMLHPTPAVCGFPKAAALDFIRENEGYDREYYAGYLGEINSETVQGTQQTDLFVNLRCMKIEKAEIHLFAGCGITKNSDPEKEYEETVNKTMTLKSVIQLK